LAEQVKDEHKAIVEAISRQDSEAARAAARTHMERASRRLGSADIKLLLGDSTRATNGPGKG
jgi:DNA-binding FadR family transcriptional regulator